MSSALQPDEDSMMSCESIDNILPIADATAVLPSDSEATNDAPSGTLGKASASVSIDAQPETTNDSTTTQPEKKSLNRLISDDVTYRFTEPKDLIEYEWPPKSGEKWMIQEQISELLQITAFKRRYPDITARQIRKEEKEYLITQHKVNTLLSEMHMQAMTALKANEVHNLLCREKPDLYAEYQRLISERMKEKMAELQKEMDRVKKDPKLLEELRMKSIKSASEFNSDLQQYNKAERNCFWDLQTSIIQSSSRKWRRLPPVMTKPSPYPVALINGQYQHYYKKFTSEELRRLPLESVMDGTDLFPVFREASPPPINVKEEELSKTPNVEKETSFQYGVPQTVLAAATVGVGATGTPQRKEGEVKTRMEIPTPKQSDLRKSKCITCSLPPKTDMVMIRCSKCHLTVHADCAEMSEGMSSVVLTYPWHCMECKLCTVCDKPDDEESLMFCDRCDRGYHTYCVGLEEPPNGSWICSRFCEAEKTATQTGRLRRKTVENK
ncbi:unnamed protein product, partial [Mesorhabditis belari]|uniref:PHD-type domain-containing protein n=1 Tax=Mesorhabditis belari TaxID=2138241 RepID=A0AAF3FQX9_9BILA